MLDLQFAGRSWRVNFPLPGDFQISNALVAAGLCIATGSEADAVFEALQTLQGAPGRLERIGDVTGATVFVDYAHKPDALEKAIAALRPFVRGRLILVFGCGGDRDPGKRPIMGEIANRLADVAIVTDDNPRSENRRRSARRSWPLRLRRSRSAIVRRPFALGSLCSPTAMRF